MKRVGYYGSREGEQFKIKKVFSCVKKELGLEIFLEHKTDEEKLCCWVIDIDTKKCKMEKWLTFDEFRKLHSDPLSFIGIA